MVRLVPLGLEEAPAAGCADVLAEIARGLLFSDVPISASTRAAAHARLMAAGDAAVLGGREGGEAGSAGALAARSLPTLLLYDEAGLELFDRITTDADEYYLTEAEASILRHWSPAILDAAGMPRGPAAARATLVELGAGSMRKTRLLLDALASRASDGADDDGAAAAAGLPAGGVPTFVALDLCEAPLRESLEELSGVFGSRLNFVGLVGTYEEGLGYLGRGGRLAAGGGACGATQAAAAREKSGAGGEAGLGAGAPDEDGPRLFLWLGSSIGNMERADAAGFLRRLRGAAMRPGDRLLVGIDRRNAPELVSAAYDDAKGITRAFALNGLTHAARLLAAAAGSGDASSSLADSDDDAAIAPPPSGPCAGAAPLLASKPAAGAAARALDVSAFDYLHHYNQEEGRHEGYYLALRDTAVSLPAAAAAAALRGGGAALGMSGGAVEVALRAGDLVRFEVSHKYSPDEVASLAAAAGLAQVAAWADACGMYDLHLFAPAGEKGAAA